MNRALALLGFKQARTGVLVALSLVVLGLGMLAVVAVALSEGRSGGHALADVPMLAARLLAWDGGVLLAFAAAGRAFRRDRDDGVRALVRARGGSTGAYVWCRLGGLVALLALTGAGSTAVVALVTLALAPREVLGHVVAVSGASLLYAVMAALTLGPVALATLGARSRASGYVWFLGALFGPALAERWIDQVLPPAWQGLASIPGALGGLRSGLMPGAVDLVRIGCSLIVLAVVVALAIVGMRQQLARADGEAGP